MHILGYMGPFKNAEGQFYFYTIHELSDDATLTFIVSCTRNNPNNKPEPTHVEYHATFSEAHKDFTERTRMALARSGPASMKLYLKRPNP